MRRRRFALAAAAAVALVAGCGGGSSASYSAAATASCLTKAGATVDRSGADYIAADAGGGGFLVTLADRKILNVAFGRDGGEASEILDDYQAIGGGDSGTYRKGNAVLVWDDEPGDDRATVDGCLN